MDTSFAALKKYAFRSTLVFWGLAPVVLLCLIWWLPDFSSRHSSLLMGSVVLWALAAFTVFCYTASQRLRPEAVESLTCSIFLGILSIGLTSVGIVGSPFNLPATLSAKGDPLALPILPAPTRTLCVAAIDLPPDAQQPGAAQDRQLDLIQGAMQSIFLPDSGDFALSFASSRQHLDSLRIYASSSSLPDWTNEVGGEGRRNIFDQMVRNLRESLREKFTAPQAASLSAQEDTQISAQVATAPHGITQALGGTLCAEIHSHPDLFSHVKVVVFSTWEDPVPTSDFQALTQCLSDGAHVSILAFCLPSSVSQDGTSCVEKLNASHLPQEHWQALSLVAFDNLTAEKRMLALEPLYNLWQEDSPFRLKYYPYAPLRYPSSNMTLPLAPNERAFLKLRSTSTPIAIEVTTDAPNSTWLKPIEGEDLLILPPRQDIVELRLAKHQKISPEQELELEVAIPSRAALYRVRVSPMAIPTDSILTWLFLLTATIQLFPIPVALLIWKGLTP